MLTVLCVIATIGVLSWLVIRHLDRKIARQDSLLAAAGEKMAALFEILATENQHITIGDLTELRLQVQQEEARFDATVAEAVGVIGLSAVKAGPMKVCWTQEHGGRC